MKKIMTLLLVALFALMSVSGAFAYHSYYSRPVVTRGGYVHDYTLPGQWSNYNGHYRFSGYAGRSYEYGNLFTRYDAYNVYGYAGYRQPHYTYHPYRASMHYRY